MFGFLVTGERRLASAADVARAGFDFSAEDRVFGASGAVMDGARLPDLNTDFTTPNDARCGARAISSQRHQNIANKNGRRAGATYRQTRPR